MFDHRSLSVGRLCTTFLLAAAFVLLSSPISAQSDRPLPSGPLTVADQPDSPVKLTVNASKTSDGREVGRSITIENMSDKPVWGCVIVGVPGLASSSTMFGTPIEPGGYYVLSSDQLGRPFQRSWDTVSVDAVVFPDGAHWGPDASGSGSQLRGSLAGMVKALADAKGLLFDEPALRELLTRQPSLPELTAKSNKTKWEMGFVSGYQSAIFTMRRDLEDRGDVRAVAGRIEAMVSNLTRKKE